MSGIIETVSLAGSVLFAAPVALFGADLLLGGNTGQGVVFLAIAASMVVVPRYLWMPSDVAGDTAERVASAVVKTDDEEP